MQSFAPAYQARPGSLAARSGAVPLATPRQVQAIREPLQRLQAIAAPDRSAVSDEWKSRGTAYEYGSAANPDLSPIPVDAFTGRAHESGPESGVVPLDLSEYLETDYPATAPNLLANFVKIVSGKRLDTYANATSQAFYVLRGKGSTKTEWGSISWSKGDVFVLPAASRPVTHHADADDKDGAAFYWVHDEPLLNYLGVKPNETRFEPTLFRAKDMTDEVMRLRNEPGSEERNRCGILLATESTAKSTKTLSHVLWALYNLLPAKSFQKPHKHSALALDLAIYAPEGTYTMMGPDLNSQGDIIDPVRVDWATGGMFTTPPGWWHSHHNDSDEDAWVFPIQDAALYTYQRTLNIRFGPEEAQHIQEHRQIGATFKGKNIRVHHANGKPPTPS